MIRLNSLEKLPTAKLTTNVFNIQESNTQLFFRLQAFMEAYNYSTIERLIQYGGIYISRLIYLFY